MQTENPNGGKAYDLSVSAVLAHNQLVELSRDRQPWLYMVPTSMREPADAWGRVPDDHPLVLLRQHVDSRLAQMPHAEAALAQILDCGLSPQMLLRACILKSICQITVERYLEVQLSFNVLYRWFVALPAGGKSVESIGRALRRLGQDATLLALSSEWTAELLNGTHSFGLGAREPADA